MPAMRPRSRVGISRWALRNWQLVRVPGAQRVGWEKAPLKIKGQIMGNVLHSFKELCALSEAAKNHWRVFGKGMTQRGPWERSLWTQQWWERKRGDWYWVSTQAPLLLSYNKIELSSQHRRRTWSSRWFYKIEERLQKIHGTSLNLSTCCPSHRSALYSHCHYQSPFRTPANYRNCAELQKIRWFTPCPPTSLAIRGWSTQPFNAFFLLLPQIEHVGLTNY